MKKSNNNKVRVKKRLKSRVGRKSSGPVEPMQHCQEQWACRTDATLSRAVGL